MKKYSQLKISDAAEARILGKEESELFLEATHKAAEQFGLDSAAYRMITQGINAKNVTGSQYFWTTHLNSCLPNKQKIISLEEMELINNVDVSFFQGFYTYIPEIILRTEVPINGKDVFILQDLSKQIKDEHYDFSSRNPLRISNLALVKDENNENPYGLLLKIGDDTCISSDSRFVSNSGCNIPFGKKTIRIWNQKNGVSAICLGAGVSLYADGGFGLYADCICGSVVMETRNRQNPGHKRDNN